MIFQHTHDKVAEGLKTQTRRIVKEGQRLTPEGFAVLSPTGKAIYEVGKDYAVQSGRGKSCVVIDGKPLRICILSLEKEDVRYISGEDVKAEGFESHYGFFKTWCAMHDKKFYHYMQYSPVGVFLGELPERPSHFYQAWVIKFEALS